MSFGLPVPVRRWIVINAIVVTALINVVVNATIAWLSAIGRSRIPLWAPPLVDGPSTITDTVATIFLLPFTTCILVTAAVRRDLRRGALQPLKRNLRLPLAHLPMSALRRGAIIGAGFLAALAPVAIAVLVAAQVSDLSVRDFVIFKVLFAVALGLVVTPVIALAALIK
jgi:hypothetical protein